ncbi:MAG: hypothetical protein ABSF59_18480 [Candidatus Sulfotelmatobacter sp.]|jgi:hypothetical protein
MNQSEKERIAKLLKQSLPRVEERVEEEDAHLGRDLWPAMLRRLQQPAERDPWFEGVWLDWALGAAVVAWLVFFPAAIPLLLYHL